MPHALSFTRTSKICMFIDKGFAHRTCTKTLKTLHMMVRAETEFIDCCLLCVVLLIFCVVLTISTLQSNVMLQYNAQTETHQIRPPQNHYLFIFHVHVHEQSGRCVTCWQSILSIDVHELIKVFPCFRYYNCTRPIWNILCVVILLYAIQFHNKWQILFRSKGKFRITFISLSMCVHF